MSAPLLDQSVETASQVLSIPLPESPERTQRVAPVIIPDNSPVLTSDTSPVLTKYVAYTEDKPEEEKDPDVETESDTYDPNSIVFDIL